MVKTVTHDQQLTIGEAELRAGDLRHAALPAAAAGPESGTNKTAR